MLSIYCEHVALMGYFCQTKSSLFVNTYAKWWIWWHFANDSVPSSSYKLERMIKNRFPRQRELSARLWALLAA